MFLLAFTSADIIFYKFLELNSTLTGKKIFITNSLFNRFTQPPNIRRYCTFVPPFFNDDSGEEFHAD